MWKIMKENLEDLLSPNLWRSVACEMTGTLVIVLMGCGTWITSEPMARTVQVALAFGLSVATMVWVFSHISGGHFNPALTAAMVVTRQVSIVRGVLYVLAQMVGGILGAGILYGLSPGAMRMTLGVTHIVDGGLNQAQGFGVELFITLVFVLAFFASRDRGRSDLQGSSPLTVGLAVVACHLFAINYTGAGMNCARSFGPAVIMNTWDDHWVYWVGPVTGGLLGGLLYHYVFSEDATLHKTTKCLLRTKKHSTPKPAAAAAAEKPPLEGVGAAPEVIEIDENEATAPLAGSVNEAAAATEVVDSDKAKLTEATKE